MKYIKTKKPFHSSSDFWYDVFDGGYIVPSELLTDPSEIKKVEEAIALLQQFQEELTEKGIIEII